MRPMMQVDGSMCPEVTHLNHLRHWIGPRFMSTYRLGDYEAGRLEMGQCTRKPMQFKAECLHAAQLVYETHCDQGQPVAIMFSGGVDSELTLRSFVESKIPITVHHMRYKDGLNAYDTNHVDEFCKSAGIKPVYHDFDPVRWYLSGEAIEFGKFYECSQLVYLACCYHIKNYIGSVSVFGGEIVIRKYVDVGLFMDTGETKHRWYFTMRENQDLVTVRFSAHTQIPVVNEFFTYTPEIVLAFLEEPLINNVVFDRDPHKLSVASTKNKAYARTWDFQPRLKAHGYERMLGLNSDALNVIKDHMECPPHEDLKLEIPKLITHLRQGLM